MDGLMSWRETLVITAVLALLVGLGFFLIQRRRAIKRARSAKELALQISQFPQFLISIGVDKRSIILHLRAPSGIRNILVFSSAHPDFVRISDLTLPATLQFTFQSTPLEAVGSAKVTRYLRLRLSHQARFAT